MKLLFTTALAGKLADAASNVAGTNPFVRLGAAGLAARIAVASLPLALVAYGAVTVWGRYRKNDKTRTPAKSRRKSRSNGSSKKAANHTASPAAA